MRTPKPATRAEALDRKGNKSQGAPWTGTSAKAVAVDRLMILRLTRAAASMAVAAKD